jgi:hypothetical protein
MTSADRRLQIDFTIHDYVRHMGHGRQVAELALDSTGTTTDELQPRTGGSD